uniref:Retrovirus-related Pol polyprotein from transposon TNT 1-94 n=1 Tax=Tanacetum cinerariifolium TaxID=118510 RepID=A0A6L2K7H9_TANCI|nr:retrovirus-related Pol polyprotein from transposon TNT 1-94 [Tanacetum cinerariifolium]
MTKPYSSPRFIANCFNARYLKMELKNKNLMDINIDALSNILNQNQGDVNDAMGLKKKTVVVTSDPLALIADDSNQEINANMVFMAQIEKVLSDSEASSSSADNKIVKENPNVIAPGKFKLSVSQSVSPISVTKTSCASNSVENLNTLSGVRRPKPNCVMWMRSAFDCNNARNALCNARMNDLFIFDDVSIRKSHVSKMHFRKKPSASLNVPSRRKLNKSLPRIMHCPDLTLDHRFGMFKAYDGVFELDNGMEFKNKTLAKLVDELALHKHFDKTPYELMNKRKPNIKFFCVFGCRCYLLNDYDDVGKLKEKGDIRVFVGYSKESAAFRIYKKQTQVEVPSSNTQPVSNNMVPNVDEATTSHNVFNERLEDAYFDASTLFHDPSNVHTFYQPYPHEKKWTKDHPLHKIIGDPKSSVCTRGQLANSCLLSSIKPANVAGALKDVD